MAKLDQAIEVWVYPADGILGGPVEPRLINEILAQKVVYITEDKYGFLGAKRSKVYFTKKQAEIERFFDA